MTAPIAPVDASIARCWDGLPEEQPYEVWYAAARQRWAQLCPPPPHRMHWHCSGDASSRLPDWRIFTVIDHGPTEHYRYAVEGYNLNCGVFEHGRRLSWRVPSISNPRYDLSRATIVTRNERKAS